MPRKKLTAFKRFVKRVDDAPSSYESLLWVFLVVAYFFWAALSPMLPNSEGGEPLVPLAILGFLSAFYFFNFPHRLYFLVYFSVITNIAAPLILALNIYRAFAGLFPALWKQAGFSQGPVVFIGIQLLGLLLAVGSLHYTVRRWKNADKSEKQDLKRQSKLFLFLVILLFAPVIFFVLAGLMRRG